MASCSGDVGIAHQRKSARSWLANSSASPDCCSGSGPCRWAPTSGEPACDELTGSGASATDLLGRLFDGGMCPCLITVAKRLLREEVVGHYAGKSVKFL